MIIYTYQLAHWRRLQDRGIRLVDTTVKTGHVQLSPTWDMVLGYKNKTLSEEAYTSRYKELLEYWWFQEPEFFEDLLKESTLAFGCYCPAGKFCHRLLLVEFFKPITSIDYRGELT